MSNKKTKKRVAERWRTAKKWLVKNEKKIVLAIGIFLLSIISFEFGILQGQKWQQDPLVIKVPKESLIDGESEQKVFGWSNENAQGNLAEQRVSEVDNKNKDCVFVGSKKSNKYHKADCRFAKRIKAENKICFKNANDAKQKGYVPAHCIGESEN